MFPFFVVLQDVPVDPIGGMKCVYFPDVNFTEIQKFVEQIYKGRFNPASPSFEWLLGAV
jgi:hypothetical protein